MLACSFLDEKMPCQYIIRSLAHHLGASEHANMLCLKDVLDPCHFQNMFHGASAHTSGNVV